MKLPISVFLAFMFIFLFLMSPVKASNLLIRPMAKVVSQHSCVYVFEPLTVTFLASGLDPTASGTVLTVNGSDLPYANLPCPIAAQVNDTIIYSYSNQVSSATNGKRFSLTNVSGQSSPITVTGNATIAGSYKIQYYLNVSSPYDDGPFSSNEYGSPSPTSDWFDSGSIINESVSSPVVPGWFGSRAVCTGWFGTGSVPTSGTDLSITFTINVPSNITWIWQRQYFLGVDSPSGTTNNQGWYCPDSTVYASLNVGTVDYGNGTRLLFQNWEFQRPKGWEMENKGTNYSQSDAITMGGGGTFYSIWKIQYQITFDQVGIDSTSPGTVLSVDAENYTVSHLPQQFWWDADSIHNFSFISPLMDNDYTWNSTGGLLTSRNGNITITGPGSVVGTYENPIPEFSLPALILITCAAATLVYSARECEEGRKKIQR